MVSVCRLLARLRRNDRGNVLAIVGARDWQGLAISDVENREVGAPRLPLTRMRAHVR